MARSIEFKLFAPYNKGAVLKGCFSDWQDIQMEKGEDGYFRTSVELEDGTYQYKFCVQSKSWFLEPDQWVDVTDPYATGVIDDETQNGVVRIKDGQRIVDTYTWQHDDTPLPQNHELVIYEMHIGDFSGGEDDSHPRGQFKHVVEKIDYLCELGINAIQLMPMMEYPGDYSWGYNVRHFFALESSYGETEELKHLIDQCHSRGIRVIVDGIFNHSESEHPLTQIDHDYWYHHEPPHEFSWGPEFNYEHYDENLEIKPAWKFIGDVVLFWIEEYHIDGIRYDAAKQIENYDFMHWITEQAHKKAGDKPFYNVAEHIPETPSITNVDGPMDGCWHDSFAYCLKDHIFGDTFDVERLKDALDGKRQGFMGAVNLVNYLTSHDQERLMVELADHEIFDEVAFKRIKFGVALLMTAVGIPLILMGEEFGEYKPLKPESSKLDWTLLKNEESQGLLDYYKGLIRLRKENYALYGDNIDFFYEDPEAKVLGYIRWNDEGSQLIIIANFSDHFLEGYAVSQIPESGKWHEWTRDYDVEVVEGKLELDLGEYEAKVFVWQ
ncbi:MAG: alpha-amylase family glycosyl hydrolase [Coleofasciculus sp. B1-GNL1-01]|uniref:alpha-amylase family glycosyl hydrolase n=1 Tax=Coleofasciculus sp. B1-GNL1-01 TaxID=3068484 RepID=UPI0032F2A8D1